MTDIIATLKPAQGIQCEQSLLYLFDPNVVISITETTTREWLEQQSEAYLNEYIKPIMDAYEQEKERQIDAYVEEKQSTIFFDNTNFTGITTAEQINVSGNFSADDITANTLTVLSSATIPAPTTDNNPATKKYVDDAVSGLTNFADKDLSNLTSQGKNIANWSSNVSNCITEIPQDIKLELNNGTLILKAGSKVYVPNGAGVFDEIIIDSDKSVEFQSWGSHARMFFYNPTTDTFTGNILTYTTSGSSASPSNPTWVWYDTTNNLVKRTENSGSTWESGWALPVCICSNVQNTSSSIDQVFNGFGYIGSTIFALPGVKGLIPDGRNEDGSLKSVEITLDTVLTATPGNGDFDFYIRKESIGWSYTYHKDINFNTLSTDETALRAFAQAGHYKKDSSGITSFTTKTPFHTVDYNDTEFIGHQAMPSGRYISLTLGASGTTYTAPADGWFILSKRVTATGQYVTIQANGYVDVGVGYANGGEVSTMIFVKKGAVALITYSAGGTLERFRFIYTEGSK